MRSGESRPAPRSWTGGKVGANTRQPVARAIRSAARRPRARRALPPSTNAAVPARNARAARSVSARVGEGGAGIWAVTGAAATCAHCTSPGRISVAGPLGSRVAWAIASAMSAAADSAWVVVWTKCDIGLASPAMSDVRGALAAMCQVACSPTMDTTGEPALRALCKLARPLASPGPRCNSASAGRPLMRV